MAPVASRDWAAKGTRLLGVKAVIAQSFERIHRSNLVGMGVLPCQFKEGVSAQTLNLDGTETFEITGLEASDSGSQNVEVRPRQDVRSRFIAQMDQRNRFRSSCASIRLSRSITTCTAGFCHMFCGSCWQGRRDFEENRALRIDVLPMPDIQNCYTPLNIINLIDGAVIAISDSPAFASD